MMNDGFVISEVGEFEEANLVIWGLNGKKGVKKRVIRRGGRGYLAIFS